MYSRWADQHDYDAAQDPDTTCSASSACGDEDIEIQPLEEEEIDASTHADTSSPDKKRGDLDATFDLSLDADEFYNDEHLGVPAAFLDESIIVNINTTAENPAIDHFASADDATAASQQSQLHTMKARALFVLATATVIFGALGFVTELPSMTFFLLAAIFSFLFSIVSVSFLVR